MVMKLLFSLDSTNRPHFDRGLLRQITEQIGERQVAIISTVGGFREGKSFFDNILLKGLQMRGDVHFEANEVIGGSNGVPFKRGTERHTVGIQIWDRVFYRKDQNGIEIAVLLLDTQGMFDMQSQIKQSTIIFMITLMISSHLIYNKMKLLDARDLDQLNVFIEMSRLGREKIGQNLLFLMRDWQGDGDGGNSPEYLAGLRSSSARTHELKKMLDGVYEAFEKVECWTVFPPGGSVVRADGSIRAADCDPTFLQELSACANHILRNLATRKVMGTALNGKTFETYIQQVVDHVRDNSVHCVSSALEATTRLCFENAKEMTMKRFSEKIQELGSTPISGDILRAKLAQITSDSLKFYESQPHFGSSEEKNTYLMVITKQFKLKSDEMINRNEERLRQQQENQEKQRQIEALVAAKRQQEKRIQEERQRFLREQRLREQAERARQEEQQRRERVEEEKREEQRRHEQAEQARRERESQMVQQMQQQMMALRLQTMQSQSQPSGFSGGYGNHPSPTNNYFLGGQGSSFGGNRSAASHSCHCRTGCSHGNCGCRRRGQQCNDGCGCTNCVN